jgi:DNA-3-methyladenine glycosylase
MWGPPGTAYVYFIYGNHCCANAVCQPEGIAEAVLIRAVEAMVGLEILGANRPMKNLVELTNGPGKLCAAMKIDRALDGADLCRTDGPLFIAAHADQKRWLDNLGPIVTSRRIGITKAADLPLRFYVSGSAFVSRKERKSATV